MRHRALLLPPLALALLGAVGFGWAASGAIEARTMARLARAAQAGGHDWLRIEVDGLSAALGGDAPDAAAATAALAAARAAAPLAALRDAITVAAAAPPQSFTQPQPQPDTQPAEGAAAPAIALEILRAAGGVTLIGVAPNPQARDRLAAALAEAALSDGAGSAAAAPAVQIAADAHGDDPPNWRALEAAAVSAAEHLRLGRIAFAPGSFAVSGLPASEAARIAIERGARALRAGGVAVTLDLAAPAAQAGAPVFDIELRAGAADLRACATPDAAAAETLTQALAQALGAVDLTGGPCAPLDGAAESAAEGAAESAAEGAAEGAAESLAERAAAGARWSRVAQAGLAALRQAQGGRFRLEGVAASFAAAGAGAGQVDAAVARLAAAMPEGFSLTTEGVSPAPPAPAVASGAVWLRVRATPELVLLTGAAPDIATRAAVTSYAAAVFGAERVHEGMAVAQAHGAEGWRAAALGALDALAQLDSGAVEVVDGRVALTGVTRDPAAVRVSHLALAAPAQKGWRGETKITVDLAARAAQSLLAPQACAARMSEQTEGTPILFATGSAEIANESAPALDALSATLRRCANGAIEVGGHTDSQGSAGYNLSLSQARAEAVRAALVARGAPSGALVARGYGEHAPIADNADEAGRARNRRIAFTALPPPAARQGEAPDSKNGPPLNAIPETTP